jgi:hypothetical protein
VNPARPSTLRRHLPGFLLSGSRLRVPRGWFYLLLIPVVIVVAQGVVNNPAMILVGMSGTLVLATAAMYPMFFPRIFIASLGLLLCGYTFFGRAFAHVGVPPVFVGEVVLTVGLFGMLNTRRRWAAFRSPIIWVYLVFAGWGAARAIPYLPRYGVDVLRDSVLWAYGAFAILIPALVVRPGWLSAFLERYARWVPVLVLWLPAGLLIGHMYPHLLPQAQSSGEEMELVKPSGAGVHLAGAATFFLLGLHRIPGHRRAGEPLGSEWIFAGAGIVAFIAIAVFGRGGALSVLVAVFVVMVFRPVVAIPRMVLVGGLAVGTAFLFLALNVSIELGRRDFSVYQLTSNLMSIVGDTPDDEKNLTETRDWRLRWWTKIIDYTVYGPYFWTGKGFGVSLPIDDGIKEDTFNRSPHSAHMTVLARMGVPGEVIWLSLLSTFGVSMLAAYLRARRLAQEWWARLNLWILVYWLAFLVAASFGVYLEGPYGGICFWSLIGLGIAVLQAQKGELALSRAKVGASG